MLIGIDVGGSNASALLVDPTTWAIVGRERTTSEGDGPALVERLATMVGDLQHFAGSRVRGVPGGVSEVCG